jgi:hypothetical protein
MRFTDTSPCAKLKNISVNVILVDYKFLAMYASDGYCFKFGVWNVLSMPKLDDKCEDLSCILTTSSPDEIFCPVYKATSTIKGSAWRSPSVPFKTANG